MREFDRDLFEQGCDITGVERKNAWFVGAETKYWLHDDSFLYKLDDEDCFGFGELAMSHFSKILGFDCVNAYPAVDFSENDRGVIIESFLDDETTISRPLYDILDNAWIERGFYPDTIIKYCTPEEVLSAEEAMKENEGLCFEDDIEYKLKQMAIVDFMFCQYDRHANNIEFVLRRDPKTGQNVLCLAPLFDNGRMLGIGRERKYESAHELAKELLPKFCMYDISKEDKYLPIINISKSIAKEIAKDPRLKQFYNGFLQLDIRSHLEYISKAGGYNFPPKKIEYMAKVFDIRKKLLEKHLLQIETKNKYSNKHSFSKTKVSAPLEEDIIKMPIQENNVLDGAQL